MRKTLDTELGRGEASSYCVVGYGRVGSVTAILLRRQGVKVKVFDASSKAIEKAKRLGFDATLANVLNRSSAREIVSNCDVIGTALPSRVAEVGLHNLVAEGASVIVDVSYVQDPLAFRRIAESNKVKLFVDTGLAPGLSNILVAHASKMMNHVDSITIYVGGISADPSAPLGIVISWNAEDLIEEYTRPARAIVNGHLVYLDPIDNAIRVELPGLGAFDAMPTDGLRTLIETFKDVREMIEYTLRYPGHVDFFKQVKRLGLLSDREFKLDSLQLTMRKLLALVLEQSLPTADDRVVMKVVVKGVKDSTQIEVAYTIDVKASSLKEKVPTALALLTGAVHSYVMILAGRGYGRIGLNKPEELGFNDETFKELVEFLGRLGVVIREEVRTLKTL
jgi:saccharopine dehydrogenase-like NADP-dependent oxidoreductase